jgi:hypothetical protein
MKPYLDKPILYSTEYKNDNHLIIYFGKNENLIEIKTPNQHVISLMSQFFKDYDVFQDLHDIVFEIQHRPEDRELIINAVLKAYRRYINEDDD